MTDPPAREYPPPPWWGPAQVIDAAIASPPPIVITELNKTTYLREEKAFFAAIAAGEVGSRGDFNTLYGGTEWTGSLDSFPNWSGVVVTDASGQQSVTHAYGAPQFEPGTFNLIAGLTGKTDVNPPSQILNGLYLAYKDFRTRSGLYLLDVLKANQLNQIPVFLGLTWPGGASSSFPARYTSALAMFPVIDTPPANPPPGVSGLIDISISAKIKLTDLTTILAIIGKTGA